MQVGITIKQNTLRWTHSGVYIAHSSMILLCVCNDALLIFLTKNGYADDDK